MEKEWKLGDKAFFRPSYERCKKWHICIKECIGKPKDNDGCFKEINTYKYEDRKWNVGDIAYFRIPFERCRWYTCISTCVGFPQENIECFK